MLDARRLFFDLVPRRTFCPRPQLAFVSLQWSAQHRLACKRSSIKSRSTSHNLSDESKSLSICSASADSSSFKWFVCHTSDRLSDCRDRSLIRDVRLRLCSHRADPISYPFLINWFLSRSSHRSIGAVVPNSWAVRARILSSC